VTTFTLLIFTTTSIKLAKDAVYIFYYFKYNQIGMSFSQEQERPGEVEQFFENLT